MSAWSHEVRYPPLPRDQWPAGAEDAVNVLPEEMRPPPGAQINVLSVLARRPGLLKQVLLLGMYFRFESELNGRQRELLILRTAWIRRGEYELLRHTRLARKMGFTDAELAALTVGSTDPSWSPPERLLLQLVEEMCAHNAVTDATFAAMQQHYTDDLIIDAVFCVATYVMFSVAYAPIGMPPEDDLPPFPVPLPD